MPVIIVEDEPFKAPEDELEILRSQYEAEAQIDPNIPPFEIWLAQQKG